MATTAHHQVLIVGGGTAGISVAARLWHARIRDVGLLDPAATHCYQPLWTLVGGGRAPPCSEVSLPGLLTTLPRAARDRPHCRLDSTQIIQFGLVGARKGVRAASPGTGPEDHA